MNDLWQRYGPGTEMAAIVAQIGVRLILAAFLGGLIGLERELKHKPAGLRTNLVDSTRKEHGSLLKRLRQLRSASRVESLGEHEHE